MSLYLTYGAINIRLIPVDLAPGEAPAGMGLEATHKQALLHGRVQQDGAHARDCEFVGHEALQDVCQQVTVLLKAAALFEDQSSELFQGQSPQVRMLLPPVILHPRSLA